MHAAGLARTRSELMLSRLYAGNLASACTSDKLPALNVVPSVQRLFWKAQFCVRPSILASSTKPETQYASNGPVADGNVTTPLGRPVQLGTAGGPGGSGGNGGRGGGDGGRGGGEGG